MPPVPVVKERGLFAFASELLVVLGRLATKVLPEMTPAARSQSEDGARIEAGYWCEGCWRGYY